MKSRFRQILVFVLVIVLSGAAAITGFAVSAASENHVTSRANSQSAGASAGSALKSGVWQALYKTGDSRLFFIDDEEKSFSLIDPELGIGLPSRYEYLPEMEIYKLHIACEDNVENWRVIENNDITAVVSDAQGDVISLFYLGSESMGSFNYYTLSELSEMARACYEKQYGSSKGVEFKATMNADGSFYATVTGTKDGQKVVSYLVDMQTGKGTDDSFESVDLSQFI